jgi:predicted permease
MADLRSDVRHVLRGLVRVPSFTAVAVVSMAFGVAANSAVFTLVDQVLLRALPVPNPDELVQLSARGTESYGGGMGDGTELSYALYRELRDHGGVLTGLFARAPWSLNVTSGERTERVDAELVSGSFFPELGVTPAIGRLLNPDDERRPVAVLGFAHWRARYEADPAILGKAVVINGHPFEIVGVVESRFAGLDLGRPAQVYVPVSMQPRLGPAWLDIETRRFRWVQMFGRLGPGTTRAAAESALQPLYASILRREAVDAAFAQASAETRSRFLEGRLSIDDASKGHSGLREEMAAPLLILMAVAVSLLIIVCTNVANLLIARGASRQRELALRLAVGATPLRVGRLLLVESLVLASFGGALGVLLSHWGADLLLAFYEAPGNPLAVSPSPDGRVMLFTAAIVAATAVLAGIVPALRSARLDPGPELEGSGRSVVGEHSRLRKTLVVAQVALSFSLLIGAGGFLRSLGNLLAVDPGFRTARVLTFTFDLAQSGYEAAGARTFARRFLERAEQVPGVSGAGYAFVSLLGGGGWGMRFSVEGYEPPPGESAASLCNAVSPEFFRATGMRLLAGREFDDADEAVEPPPAGWPYRVAVVNQTFAERYFGGANPIGRRIGIGDDPGAEMPIEVVGLVEDARYTGIREDPRPQVFFPYLQGTIETVTAYVPVERAPEAVMPELRREVAALDPRLALYDVSTLEEKVDRSVVNERLIASLSTALATLATLLSVIGLYGVMAYLVTRRTREFGIRMALGAPAARIAAGVLGEAGVLVGLGLGLGGVGTWWLAGLVRNQLYGVSPADPAVIAVAALLLGAVAAVAAVLPARRAVRVTPMAALRRE